MLILMAVAPNGGIAIKNLNSSKALAVDGRSYDPFGDTWNWTGRTPYLPSQQVANMIPQRARRPLDAPGRTAVSRATRAPASGQTQPRP